MTEIRRLDQTASGRATSALGVRAVAAFVVLAAVLPAALAHAGPAADKAAAAEALLQQPDRAIEALQTFDDAIDAFWKTLPLTFRGVAFADSVTGYGDYVPRAQAAVFNPGDEVQVYVALAGYALRKITTGYRVDFSPAVQIRNATGSIIARNDDLGELVHDTTLPNHEFSTGLMVTLPYLKPGAYTLRVAVRDNQSGKLAGADLPFTVVPFPSP